MMIESGYCAMDPSQKAMCFFEYTGQFLCEKSLSKAIELLEERKEPWKYEQPGSTRRNLLGGIWDLQFFVSRQEKVKYDKQRVTFMKDELAAKAAIKTEEDALAQLESQREKCTNDTQKQTLDKIMKRRRANLDVQNKSFLVARKRIQSVMPFLKPQIWKEEVDPRKGKGSLYVNRYTGEKRYTKPPSWWRLVSCSKSIQRYYRAYSARIIAEHGFCEVFSTLAPKFVCFFDPPGSGTMKMSLTGCTTYLNDGKGMMRRHTVKTFERLALEEACAKKIHRVCKRYRVKMNLWKIWMDVASRQEKSVLVLQRVWRAYSTFVVGRGAFLIQQWISCVVKTERRYILPLDVAVPDAIKLQEKLAEARQHEIEAATARKRMLNLYSTQYVDDYNDIVEVTQVAAAKRKELRHIEIIKSQTRQEGQEREKEEDDDDDDKEEEEEEEEEKKHEKGNDEGTSGESEMKASEGLTPIDPSRDTAAIPPILPQTDQAKQGSEAKGRKKLATSSPSSTNSSSSDFSDSDEDGSRSCSSSYSSSYFESPRTMHDRAYKELNDAKDCSGLLKWVLPFLVPCPSNQRALAPEMGQRQILQIAEVRSATLMQRSWRTRIAFKKARLEILRRVKERRRLEAERIALENYSATRISNCYRCLIARRVLFLKNCGRRLAIELAEDVCDIPKTVKKHDALWNEHKGFLGQVCLNPSDLLRAIAWSRRPARHPLINQEVKMKAFPGSQKLVQGTITIAARTSRRPINVLPPPPEQGVNVLHRGPGGIVPLPLTSDESGLIKAMDDDPYFSDWEGRALPPMTLKLQLISAFVKRDARPIATTSKRKLMGAANIVGRMGRDVHEMRRKRALAEERKIASSSNLVPEGQTKITVRQLYEEVSEQLLNRLEKAFISCDDNGDGVLSRKEVIMAALSNADVRELLQLPPVFSAEFDEVFDRLDADKNDSISFEEFQHFFLPSSGSGVDAKYARVKAGFDLMDKNGDGSLSRTEILTSLMGEQCIRNLLNVSDPESLEFEEMYRKMDTDNSGEISWVEFRNFFFPEYEDEVSKSASKLSSASREKEREEKLSKKKRPFNARAVLKRAVKKTTSLRLLSSISGKPTEVEVGSVTPTGLVEALNISKSGASSSEIVAKEVHPFISNDTSKFGNKAVQLTIAERTRALKLRKVAKKIKGAKFHLGKNGALQVVGKGGATDAPCIDSILGKDVAGAISLPNGGFIEADMSDVAGEEGIMEDDAETDTEAESDDGHGILLEIISACDLGMADSGFFSKGASDPYVVVMLGDKVIHKTGVIYDNVNPSWDPVDHQGKAILKVSPSDFPKLSLHVFDYDALGDDEFLGMVAVDRKQLEDPTEEMETVNLVKNPSLSTKANALVQGSITVRFSNATEQDFVALLSSTSKRSSTGKPKTSQSSFLLDRAKSSVPMFRSQTASIESDSLLPPCLEVTREIKAHVNWCSGGEGSGETLVTMSCQPNPSWGSSALFYLPIPESKAAFQKREPLEIQLKRGRDLFGAVTMTHADILSAIGCTTEWDVFDSVEGGYAFLDLPLEEKKKHVAGSVQLLLSFEPPARTEARLIAKEVTNDIISDILALIPQLVPRVEFQVNAIQGIRTKRRDTKETWKPTVLVHWNHSECGRAKNFKLNPVDLAAGVKRAFDLIDVNGDGLLDRIEVVNGVLQNEEVRSLLKLPPVIDDAFDRWFAELDKDNSKFISFDVFADHFLPSSAKAQMMEEAEKREQHALEMMNNLSSSDDSDGSNASGMFDSSSDNESTDGRDKREEEASGTGCCHHRPSIADVRSNPSRYAKKAKNEEEEDKDEEESGAGEAAEDPADYEISPSGLITKKKRSVFDPKTAVPFWGEEFFPLPVPEYWPPVAPTPNEDSSQRRNFIRSSGSNDKGGKLGMPMGLLEDETDVHLLVEVHDLEGKAEDEAGELTKLARTTIPVRQMYRPMQTKLDFPLEIVGRGRQLLDSSAVIQVEMCARRVKVPMWKTRLSAVGQYVQKDIMTAIKRIPQPRAELKIVDAIDLPDHVGDLKCVVLWGDRSKRSGHVGREIRQVPMNNRLSRSGKIVWDPRSRNMRLFLPAADLRRLDLEIHVHGVFRDESAGTEEQPVCLGYIQLNKDTPLLQPRQGNDKEGNPSKEVLYFPLVHSVEQATSGVLRVMQGQLGLQIRPADIPNRVNKMLKAPHPKLKVTIHDASNIARAVPFGFSNPYVKLFWGGELVAKTLVEHKTLNPVWREEQFIMPLPFDLNYLKMTGKLQKVYMLNVELRVEVWSQGKIICKEDEDGAGDKFLGQVTLAGKDLKRMPLYYFPFDLKPRVTSSDPREAIFVQGTIGMGVELHEMEVEMPVVYDDDEDGDGVDRGKSRQSGFGGATVTELLCGAKLLLHVVEGWGLAKADTFGKSDPFCIVRWGGEEIGRTKAIDDTMEPVWDEEKFTLVYGRVGTMPTLDVECYDMDITGPGDFLGMVSLEGKDLLNPPQQKDLKNGMDLPAKTSWNGGVFELQRMPSKGAKFNRMVQGHIVLGFDQSDALGRKKAHHDEIKMKRLAEAQKHAAIAALKHSVRMAKKHMKSSHEKVMASKRGRNDRDLWNLYCAHRKEYTRAKACLQFHKNVESSHFESEKAIDPQEQARIDEEFARKRAAERLKRTKKRKNQPTLSEQLAGIGARSGATIGPGGEVHLQGKKKKKRGDEGVETDFEESLRLQALWDREREASERFAMFEEDPMCLSWRPNELRERFLMEKEGVDENGLPRDAPEWEDPEPEDFDPPVLPEWNDDWKVEQRFVPMLPVNRKSLYLRIIDCRGLEEKAFPYARVWWNGKEVGRTDCNLLAEHARATGKEKAFITDPIFQYEEPFLLPIEPGKEEESHLSVEIWTGPTCRGQVTLEGTDLLRQAFKKDDIRDKVRVPFQLFPLRRTILQKTEDAIRKVVNKPRMAQGKVGLMITLMEAGSVYPPKWPVQAPCMKEFEGAPEWQKRCPIIYRGAVKIGCKNDNDRDRKIDNIDNENLAGTQEMLFEGGGSEDFKDNNDKIDGTSIARESSSDDMGAETDAKENQSSALVPAPAVAPPPSTDGDGLNRGEVFAAEEVDWEKLASIKYPDVVYKLQILSARGLKKADFIGKSDPFCMLSQGGDAIGQTEVVDESMDPVFRRATFDIPFRFISGKRKCPVVIDLYDKDVLSPDPDSPYPPKDADFMGQVTISPQELIDLCGEAHHFELKPPEGERGGSLVGGEICCSACVVKAPPPVPRYELQILRAQGLSKADRFGKSDPFVVITWEGKEIGRTLEVERTYNPDWFDDEFFTVPLHVPRQNQDKYHPDLKIEVYDMDRGKGGRRETGEFLGGFTLKGAAELQPNDEDEEVTHSLLKKEHFCNNWEEWFDTRTSKWLKVPRDGKELEGGGFKAEAIEVELLEVDGADVLGEHAADLTPRGGDVAEAKFEDKHYAAAAANNFSGELPEPAKHLAKASRDEALPIPDSSSKAEGKPDSREPNDDDKDVKGSAKGSISFDEKLTHDGSGSTVAASTAAQPKGTMMEEAADKEGRKEGKVGSNTSESKRKGFLGKMANTMRDIHNLEDTWNKADSRYSCVSGTLTYKLVLLDATERVEEWVDAGKPKVAKDETAVVCRIMDAMDLAKADITGASDPYCRVLWNYREIYRTKAINDDLHPVWEDQGCFLPTGKYRHGNYDHLKIEVYDKEAMSIGWDMGDFLGEVELEGDFFNQKHNPFSKYKQDFVLQKRKDKDPEEQKTVQGTLALHFSRKRHRNLIKNGIWWPDDDNADGRKPREWLHVNIRKALNLAKADTAILGMGGSSDPYVVVFFNRERVWDSKVINNNQNPEWNDGDEFPVPMRGFTFGPPELRIAIYDKDTVGEDEFLGQVFLTGDEVLKMDKKIVMQKKLEARMGVAKEALAIGGEIFLSTHVTLEPSFLSMVDKFDLCLPYDVVAVHVADAKKLPKSDRMGLSDPYVVVYWMGEEVARTKTIQESLNPKWDNEFFLFAIPQNLDLMELRFEVYDDDLGAIGSLVGGAIEAAGGKSKGDFLGRVTLKREDIFASPLFKKDYLLDGGPDRKKKSRQKAIDQAKADMQNLELEKVNNHYVITVSVHRARGLAKADLFGKSDPCVVAKWNGLEIGRSPIIKKSLDPDWGRHDFAEIKIDEALEDGDYALEVYDADFGKLGDFLGAASLKVDEMKVGTGQEMELGLAEKLGSKKSKLVQGHLTVSVTAEFVEVEGEEDELQGELEATQLQVEEEGYVNEEGVKLESKELTMHILEAGNLAKADAALFGMGGSSDPFVEIKWSTGKFLHKTKVKNDTQDPVWEDETVLLNVPTEINENKADLELLCDVWDKDLKGKGEFLGRLSFSQAVLLEYCESPPKRGIERELEKVMTWNAAKNKLVQGTLAVGFTKGSDEDADSPELAKKRMKHEPHLGLRTTIYKAAEMVKSRVGTTDVVDDVDEKLAVFEVGEKVLARYRGRPKWMPGVVLKTIKIVSLVAGQRAEYHYDILYDHGARENGVPKYHVKGVPKPAKPSPQQRLRLSVIGIKEAEKDGGVLDILGNFGNAMASGVMSLGSAITPKASSAVFKMFGSNENQSDGEVDGDVDASPTAEGPLVPPKDMDTQFACDLFWRGNKVGRYEGVEKLEYKFEPNAGEGIMLPVPLETKSKSLSEVKLVVRKGGGGGADGGRMRTGKFMGEMLVGWNALSQLNLHKSSFDVSSASIACRNIEGLRLFKSNLLEPLPVTGQTKKSYRVLRSRLAFIACMEEVQFEETLDPVLDVGSSDCLAKMKIDVAELRWLFEQRPVDKIHGRIKVQVSWCGKTIGWVRFRPSVNGGNKLDCLGPNEFEVQLPRDRRGCSLLVQCIDESRPGGKKIVGSLALDWGSLKHSPHVATFYNVLAADEMPQLEKTDLKHFEMFGRSSDRVLLTADQKSLTESGLSSMSKTKIKVAVLRCEGLSKADKSMFGRGDGNSDPFVEVVWDDESIGRTPTIQEDCNPVWREKNEFVIEVDDEDDSLLKKLELEVWDEDMLSKGDFLGSVTIPANILKNPTERDANGREYKLEKKENMAKSKQKMVGGMIILKISNMDAVQKPSLGALLNSAAEDGDDSGQLLEGILKAAAEEEKEGDQGKGEGKPEKSEVLLSAKDKLRKATFKTKINTGLNREAKHIAKKMKTAEKERNRRVPTRISDLSIGLRFIVEETIKESPYQVSLGLRSAGGLAPTTDVWGTRYREAQPLGLARIPGSIYRFPYGALFWRGRERARTKIAAAKVGWAERDRNVPHKHSPTFWGDEDGDGDIDDVHHGSITLPLPALPSSVQGGPRALHRTPKVNLGTEKQRERDLQCRIEVFDFGEWTSSEIRCIELMQRAVRKYLAGAFVRVFKRNKAEKARKDTAAQKIQRMVRIRQAKGTLQFKKDSLEGESATKMQCLFRGKKSREAAKDKAAVAEAKERERKRILRMVSMKIDIASAAGLAKADIGSLSDPFVEVHFQNKLVHTTAVISDSLAPEWVNEVANVEFECMDVPDKVDVRPLERVKKSRAKVESLLEGEVDGKRATLAELNKNLEETEGKIERNSNALEANRAEREALEEWNNSRRKELTRDIEGLELVKAKLQMLRVSAKERIGMYCAVTDDMIDSLRNKLGQLVKDQKRLECDIANLRQAHALWNTCRNRMLIELGYDIRGYAGDKRLFGVHDDATRHLLSIQAEAEVKDGVPPGAPADDEVDFVSEEIVDLDSIECNFVNEEKIPELRIEVYDSDGPGRKQFMGQVALSGMLLLQAAGWGDNDQKVGEGLCETSEDETKAERAGTAYPLVAKAEGNAKAKGLAKGNVTFNIEISKRVRLMTEHAIDPDELVSDVQIAGMNVNYITYSAVNQVIEEILHSVRQSVLNRPLIVRVVDAYGLRKADLWGLSDPFAVVTYEGDEIGKTQVIKDNLNPFWGQTALQAIDKSMFKLPGAKTQNPELHIDVFDWDLMEGDEDFLGKVRLPFEVLHDLRRATSKKALECTGTPSVDNPEYFQQVRTVMKLMTREEAGMPPIAGTQVTIQVHSASGLACADRFGKSDPFFICKWNGIEVGRTKVIDDTLNPVYEDETFTIFVPDGNAGRQPKGELSIECYDSDMPFSGFGLGSLLNTTGDFLGCVKCTGASLTGSCREDGTPYLMMDGEPIVFEMQPLEDGVVQGLDETEGLHTEVEVTVIAARGLAKADTFGKSDPFVKVSHSGSSLGKTPVCKSTLDPDWDEGNEFMFHIPEDADGAMMMPDDDEVVNLEVWDSDAGGLLGDFLGKVQITSAMLRNLPERGKNRERDWELEVKEGMSLKQKKLVKGILRVCVKLNHNCRGRARKIRGTDEKTSDDFVQGECTVSFTCLRADQAEAEQVKELKLDGASKAEDIVSHTGVAVTIAGANGLAKADTFGLADAMAVVKWKGIEIGKTPTCRSSLNPRWNKKNVFMLKINDDERDALEADMEKERDLVAKLDEQFQEQKEKRLRGSFGRQLARKSAEKTKKLAKKSADKLDRIVRKSGDFSAAHGARFSESFGSMRDSTSRTFRNSKNIFSNLAGNNSSSIQSNSSFRSTEELDPVAQAIRDALKEVKDGVGNSESILDSHNSSITSVPENSDAQMQVQEEAEPIINPKPSLKNGAFLKSALKTSKSMKKALSFRRESQFEVKQIHRQSIFGKLMDVNQSADVSLMAVQEEKEEDDDKATPEGVKAEQKEEQGREQAAAGASSESSKKSPLDKFRLFSKKVGKRSIELRKSMEKIKRNAQKRGDQDMVSTTIDGDDGKAVQAIDSISELEPAISHEGDEAEKKENVVPMLKYKSTLARRFSLVKRGARSTADKLGSKASQSVKSGLNQVQQVSAVKDRSQSSSFLKNSLFRARNFRKSVRSSWRKSLGKKKKSASDGPVFNMDAAKMVGKDTNLPFLTIEIYDMDYGKRGDFLGEARISLTRIMDVFNSDTFMAPLIPRLDFDESDPANKKLAKLIKGYLEVKLETEQVDAERLKMEAEERERERKANPINALLEDPDVKNGIIGIAVFADVEEERRIAQLERAEAARIANEIEEARLLAEREREADELWEMSFEDERSFEVNEREEMFYEDEYSLNYQLGQAAHDDSSTWRAFFDKDEMKHYYYNEYTQYTCWDVPVALDPQNWKPRWRRDLGCYRYDNIVTGEMDRPSMPERPVPDPVTFSEIVKNGDEDVKVWRVPKRAVNDNGDDDVYSEDDSYDGYGYAEENQYAIVNSPHNHGDGSDYYYEDEDEDDDEEE